MRIILLVGAAWLLYTYIGYPSFLLVLITWRKSIRVLSAPNYLPTVSVLIAARNEQRDIAWKINETLAWDYPPDKFELLIASDASDDLTDEIIRAIRDPRLVFVRMEQRGGKVRALNHLVAIARGEIFFFTDANAHVSSQALRLMVRHFADSRVGCVTGHSRPIDEMQSPAIAKGAQAYWGFESIVKHLESRIGSVLVCDGAIFCTRSSLYEPLHPELANDLELPMRIGAAGYWVISEPNALVFERDTSSPLEELRRRRRMCAQGMTAMLELPGTLRGVRGWQFISHKFLRWTSLVPMIMVLVGSAAGAADSVWLAGLLALQAIFYGLALLGLFSALGGRPVKHWAAVPFYVVLGVTGALWGVLEALLGKRFDIWEIPALSRGDAEALAPSAAAPPVSCKREWG